MGPGPYQLMRGDMLLGTINQLSPSRASGLLEGDLAPGTGWSSVQSLFATEAAALNHADRWPDAWQDAWDEAQGPGLVVVDGAGRAWPVNAHIEGTTVRVEVR